MGGEMWALRDFRFDDGIDAGQVWLRDDVATGGQMQQMSRDAAIAIADARGQHLIAEWPDDNDIPSCLIRVVGLPLTWEQLPEDDEDELDGGLDERLWFGASCGGLDLLVDGNPHTFGGRMAAWCPERKVGYAVSLSEMGEMSDETRYFVRGFLSGNEPDPPYDDADDIEPADEAAWRAAIGRFRRTGSWYGRWGTCEVCGCVLLPDSSDTTCHQHLADD